MGFLANVYSRERIRANRNYLFFLVNLSLLISEDFWLFLDSSSDRSISSTFVGGSKNCERRERKTQKSLLIGKEMVKKVVLKVP